MRAFRFVAAALAASAAILVAGCGAPPPSTCCHIGADFEWGTASAAYQAEGGNTTSDWYQFEQQCVLTAVDGVRQPGETITDCQSNLDGPDFWDRYGTDLAAAKAMGNNAVRLGLEWAKIEPVRGQYDPAVIAHYHQILDRARSLGLTVMVTLQHVTLPIWANDLDNPAQGLGGFAGPDGSVVGQAPIIDAFVRYAGDMAAEFGGEVDLWVPINEPVVLAVAEYVNGDYPPAEKFKVATAMRALYDMAYAHARAYDAIHARDTVDADGDGKAALVGVAKHWRVFDPADPGNADDVAAAAQLDFVFNRLWVDVVTRGKVDLNADGDTADPGESVDPSLVGRLDWLGVNYYGRYLVQGPLFPVDGVELTSAFHENPDPNVPHSDLGWEIYPEGLKRVLAAAKGYGLPLRITENGVADAADTLHAPFLVSHVAAMQAAMAAGADVRGYYWWSLTDNLEWLEGYYPRFGLFRVDYTVATRPRTPTKAVSAYHDVIQARGVTGAIVDHYGTF